MSQIKPFKKGVGFFSEIKSELKKVSWPTRESTINYTILVMILVAILTAILGTADFIFNYLVKTFINWL